MPEAFYQRLDQLTTAGLEFLVGDGDGADGAIQALLADRGVDTVTVFCVGWHPRTNIGRWPSQIVHSQAKQGSRASSAAMRLAMASSADFGLLTWDAKSSGPLSHAVQLAQQGKSSVVYIERDQTFRVIKDAAGLLSLMEAMSEDARRQIKTKTDLDAQIAALLVS